MSAGLPPVGPAEVGVFVPGLLGAGILLSAALVVSDLVALVRTGRGRARRSGTRAALLARGAVPSGAVAPPRRLAPRWLLALAGASTLGLGLYVLVGAFFNFWDLPVGTRWSDQVAWLWATLTLAALGFAGFGVGALALAARGGAASARWSAWALRTPLGRPAGPARPLPGPPGGPGPGRGGGAR